MPVAWVRTYKGTSGREGRVFASTMGGAMSGARDWDSEGFRRLFVNGAYWCVGLESEISAASSVEPVGSTNAFKRGAKPEQAFKETLAK
jgi:type 1 glutamine amidotransferase